MVVQKNVLRAIFVFFCIELSLLPAGGGAYDGACPALPAPAGTIVTVDSEHGLFNAVNGAVAGTTILIADGSYNLGGAGYFLYIDTPNVTLRSQSGDRESVILDDNYQGTEIITIAASNVTIADMTIMRAGTHPIHVVSTNSGDTLNTSIYNVHIIDPGQQAIKINPHAARTHFADNGSVACSTIELSDTGRSEVWDINGSCYTGGVDAHMARGWVIRDNVIRGFWCQQGLSEHGVHFWSGSRGTAVARNSLVDNARGIGFGLVESGTGRTYSDNPCPGGYVGHYDGIIRNNFIFASQAGLFASEYGVDGGITLAQACGAQVLHNTVAFTDAPFAAIEWRFSNTDAVLTNNLVTHNLMARNGAVAALSNNLSSQPLSIFVDGNGGNLHLANSAAAAIDMGVAITAGMCDDDFDGQARPGPGRDIGADEYYAGSGNTAPIAQAQAVTVAQGSTNTPITLTGYDDDDDELTFIVTSEPAHGALSGTAPELLFTPDAGFVGLDTMAFKVTDGSFESAEAIVSITVQGSSDSPPAANSGTTGSGGGGGGGCFIGVAGMEWQ